MSASHSISPSQLETVRAYLLKLVVATVGLCLMFTAGGQLWLPHTAAYTAVERYAAGSSAVSNTVGRVTGINPSLLGWEIYEDDREGGATLPIVVHGTRATRRAVATAVKRDGVWTVRQLSLK